MSVSAGSECFTQETVDYVQLWLFRVLAPLGLLAMLVLLGFVTRLDRDRMVQCNAHASPLITLDSVRDVFSLNISPLGQRGIQS